jgi:hypothetical protein
MCNDTPDELVFDNYYETSLSGSDARRADPRQSVGYLEHAKGPRCSDYIRALLHARTHGDFCCGKSGPRRSSCARVEDLIHANLPTDNQSTHARLQPNTKAARAALNKDLEQSHIVLGFEGVLKNRIMTITRRVLFRRCWAAACHRGCSRKYAKSAGWFIRFMRSTQAMSPIAACSRSMPGRARSDLKELVPVVPARKSSKLPTR